MLLFLPELLAMSALAHALAIPDATTDASSEQSRLQYCMGYAPSTGGITAQMYFDNISSKSLNKLCQRWTQAMSTDCKSCSMPSSIQCSVSPSSNTVSVQAQIPNGVIPSAGFECMQKAFTSAVGAPFATAAHGSCPTARPNLECDPEDEQPRTLSIPSRVGQQGLLSRKISSETTEENGDLWTVSSGVQWKAQKVCHPVGMSFHRSYDMTAAPTDALTQLETELQAASSDDKRSKDSSRLFVAPVGAEHQLSLIVSNASSANTTHLNVPSEHAWGQVISEMWEQLAEKKSDPFVWMKFDDAESGDARMNLWMILDRK
jgi:hypothetical protein